ncbi:hypothetical protein GCM10011369_34080 [Neiella marina]|uniref:Uncharacterized protein n=1 Tax=Neiella marina TaxID=508461 RepID=A0A8J2XPS6_9GAMM|nr:hypothetical protein [Neiella marina]GGA89093.1 hypothetical protein GCM10011369_34080 [Neiella marina]
MSHTLWRKVVKLAAKDFACFLMATDDKQRTVTLEAMLGCRNPNAEPVDRIYFGWHAVYAMPESELQQVELLTGSCHSLGQWNTTDLSAEEMNIIAEHMTELLSDWQQKLEQLEIPCNLEQVASAANQ